MGQKRFVTKINLRRFAREQNISVMTLYRVLNNEAAVRESTRNRVLAALNKSGAKPGTTDGNWNNKGIATGPVSHVEQFLLVSAGCHGCRSMETYDPLLVKAGLPDYFEVDHVRVFDEVGGDASSAEGAVSGESLDNGQKPNFMS